MAEESKEDLAVAITTAPDAATVATVATVATAAVIPVHAAGPPRWKSPIASEKIKVTEAPPGAAELLETTTAVADIEGGGAVVIGTGAAPRPATGAKGAKGEAVAAGAAVAGAKGKAGGTKGPRTAREREEEVPEVVTATIKPRVPFKATDQRIADALTAIMTKDKIQVKPKTFVPVDRKAFSQFIIQTFRPFYKLPPPSAIPNPNACEDLKKASASEQRAFQYQEFVRDYIQRNSPYRGVLVYHGLGSGKTCTSIAAMEALYTAGKKPVYILTPASLSFSYKEEIIMKCGPYIFRTNNHWTWVPIPTLKAPTSESELLIEVLGIPLASIRKRKGGWLPDPLKPANYSTLSQEQIKQIQEQILEHMAVKFRFINYNGITGAELRAMACEKPPARKGTATVATAATAAVEEEGEEGATVAVAGPTAVEDPDAWLRKFDGATVVIDEVHNLVRAINNSDLELFYKDEPRTMAQYNPVYCDTGKKYNRSYLMYRMLANAVGCKIIALSATPIINFPQELGILANLLAGDTRMVEVNLPTLSVPPTVQEAVRAHPEVSTVEFVPDTSSRATLMRVTPVPSGFKKVPGGFRRDLSLELTKPEMMRERGLRIWFRKIATLVESKGLRLSAEIKYLCAPRLPDLEKPFRQYFIDTEHVCVKANAKEALMTRLAGLISYYKGVGAELMATVTTDEVVRVPMSDHQLNVYTIQRKEELDKELKDRSKEGAGGGGAGAQGEGPGSLYTQATTQQSTTFKIFSREVCNFAFPPDIERPKPKDFRDAHKLLDEPAVPAEAITGEAVTEDIVDLVEEGEDSDEDATTGAATVAATATAATATAAAAGGAGARTVGKAKASADPYVAALHDVIRTLKSKRSVIFSKDTLPRFSPKFQAAVDRIKDSPGPVLVYSNFKTLAGVGLFGVTLETQLEYVRLDIVSNDGKWTLAPESLANPGKPRYISYTGDDDKFKRKILLAIYNGLWQKVPGDLVAQIKTVGQSDTNLRGELVKALLITQTGAEGLNLVNVRQVHLLEPFWNYVRMEQVKGRAVRICSHTALPPEDRTVDIFSYVTTFSDNQVKKGLVDARLMRFDAGLSTDEDMLRILTAKKVLADSLTSAMKESAVDCELNQAEHGAQTCFRFKTPSMEPAFHPIVDIDMREKGSLVAAGAKQTVSYAATAGPRERATAAATAATAAAAAAEEGAEGEATATTAAATPTLSATATPTLSATATARGGAGSPRITLVRKPPYPANRERGGTNPSRPVGGAASGNYEG